MLPELGGPPDIAACKHAILPYASAPVNPTGAYWLRGDMAMRRTLRCLAVIGFMLESNLAGGAQKHEAGRPLTYGQSITDACLSFDETVPVLEKLAQAAAARRGKKT